MQIKFGKGMNVKRPRFHEKTLLWQDPATINLLKQSLAQGHCSITSTDTILGFLAPLTEHGFSQLNILKGGRQDKPYIILIGSIDKLENFVDLTMLTDHIRNIIKHCWPAPVTFIFKAKNNLPSYLVSAQGTVALRCPQHDGLLALLSFFDGLYSTSANKSGCPPPIVVDEIDADLVAKVDYLVTDKDRDLSKSLPSTIIDVSDGVTVKIVRQGAGIIRTQ